MLPGTDYYIRNYKTKTYRVIPVFVGAGRPVKIPEAGVSQKGFDFG
jgi:hypothetical protein